MAEDKTATVVLSDRNLSEIPEEVLLKCYHIRLLDLSRNPGIRLNSFLRRFKNVRRLDLHGCALRGIPDDICELNQLEELCLSSNRFSGGLNPRIGRLHRLRKLELISCGLATVHKSIADLELLEELYLSRNNFSEGLEEAIGRIHQLKVLDLEGCGISKVPDSFGHLQLLINLNLASNKLEDYPLCTLNIKNLEVLDISNNSTWSDRERKERSGIKKLPFQLAVTCLRVLNVDGNAITEPPKAIWEQGLDAIKSYFRETNYGTNNICPDTINMVGDVRAGKSSIAMSLKEHSPSPAGAEDRTRVMDQLKASFGKNTTYLVNINDFGGHKIYHSVIPIFLPTDGLVILAYDMRSEKQERKIALERWLLTVIAKSKQIRLIVVGTHADAPELAPDMLKSSEEDAQKVLETVFEDAEAEMNHHIGHIEKLASNLAEKKKQQLRDLLGRLKNAQKSVLTVSCTCPNHPGLGELSDKISSLLKPPESMPLRWLSVIEDITDPVRNCLFIDWKDASDIYKKHITDVAGDNDLKVILRYLVSTSRIIWLEHHEVLKDRIFHLPQKIIDVCKLVLDHDQAKKREGNWGTMYSEDVKRYGKGIVQHVFMETLLGSKYRKAADTVVDFLKHFNLIGELRGDKLEYVIPSNLPDSEPPQFREIKRRLCKYDASVVIKLRFVGSLVPLSFFETSMSLMLKVVYELQEVAPEQWCKGVLFVYKGVTFAARCEMNIITLAAYSEKIDQRNPWTVLKPVLRRFHENVIVFWHGATPECCIECPGCRRRLRKSDEEYAEVTTTLEILASNIPPTVAEPSCNKCLASIPPCLCYPTLEEIFTPEAQREITEFFSKLVSDTELGSAQMEGLIDSRPTSEFEYMDLVQLEKKFRENSCNLISGLTQGQVLKAADELWSQKLIITEEKESICSILNTPTAASRCLIDLITKKNVKGLYCAFLGILQSSLKRVDLVRLLTSV